MSTTFAYSSKIEDTAKTLVEAEVYYDADLTNVTNTSNLPTAIPISDAIAEPQQQHTHHHKQRCVCLFRLAKDKVARKVATKRVHLIQARENRYV